jgi:Zn-dependent protease
MAHKLSRAEFIDLSKAWIALSIAVAIVVHNGLSISVDFFIAVLIAAVTVGIGFLLHELAHKFVAQRYGCTAAFRADDRMLLFAIALSFVGLLFAAPGAVVISGTVTRRENGLISVAGPWTNIVLAIFFLGLQQSAPFLEIVWNFGFKVNIWLALFNMIPFWILDGKKVFDWDKIVWGATVAVGLGLMILF